VTGAGDAKGESSRKRITPSDVEQKLRTPVLLAWTGVATTTKSLHKRCLQTAVMRKWYPDFVHQAFLVQLSFAKVASTRPACSGE